jgi:rod shape-determining protein MreD
VTLGPPPPTNVRNCAPGGALAVPAEAQFTSAPATRGNRAPGTTVAVVADSQFAVTPGLPARASSRATVVQLALVLLTATVAQTLLAPHLAPPGAAPDLLLLATVAVAAAIPGPGAIAFGFAAGLAADLFLVTPFGLSAAAFTAVARAGAGLPFPRRAVLVAPRAVLSALLAGALVMLGAAALGAAPRPSVAALGLLLRAGVTTGALSPPAFAAVRRLVGGGSWG